MRLLGRKQNNDQHEERCPHCSERIPEGALECMMCGVDLRPLQPFQRLVLTELLHGTPRRIIMLLSHV